MDWVAFLEEHHIEYVTRGPNTKRGEISVRCPWCGQQDPSEHLGINPTNDHWGCLRDRAHRGKSAPWLIAGLLGCSMPQARLLAGQGAISDPSGLSGAIAGLEAMGGPANGLQQRVEPVQLHDEFCDIARTDSSGRFWRYLERRGYDDVATLVRSYDLMCCHTGRWKDRIIIPLLKDDELLGWTGRAITNPVHAPRYLSSSEAIKQAVYNGDAAAQGGRILFVVEGPFDAIKLDYYGQSHGARAVCGFGTSLSFEQLAYIRSISKLYDKVVVLFDQGALGPAFYADDWLRSPNVLIGNLPDGVDDPGDLTKVQIIRMIENLK